ncbi:hypothetical protein GCM10010532_098320 [Dactylosporangium siamense]|uniref:Uncharacterized protein n=1 Tax=Dactylosporangium siamense TaxID=685454 RepID=A0A919UHZ3_9ACTN|nr:hypothetical protein Dsi01nite_109270 [Dactylosporangium siamense]
MTPMTRPSVGRNPVAVDAGDSRPSRVRRHQQGPDAGPHATGTLPPPGATGFEGTFIRALHALAGTPAGAAAIVPLDVSGCDGRCAVPAIYDRATGAWRHLSNLSRCHRLTTTPPGSDCH